MQIGRLRHIKFGERIFSIVSVRDIDERNVKMELMVKEAV